VSRCFNYFFSKREVKSLLAFFKKPSGFDKLLFFYLFSRILSSEEVKQKVYQACYTNPIYTDIMAHIEYIAACNKYLRICENRVRGKVLIRLEEVLLDRAASRFDKHIETLSGVMGHAQFKRSQHPLVTS
jgi:hypothetical protein